MLSKEEGKHYFKQILLEEIGLNGQLAIKKARVVVIGAGGLGCPVLQYLTSCGIGTLGIVDFDTIDISNIHRQILYSANDVGKKKAEVAAEKLKYLNPSANIRVHNVMLNDENAKNILAGYDIVVDGSDNFITRYTLNDVCLELNKPLVYGSVLGFEGQIAVFNLNGSKNLRDLFPEPPNAGDVPDCSENGVLGTTTGMIGTMMAQETIKIICGISSLTNKLAITDTLNCNLRIVSY